MGPLVYNTGTWRWVFWLLAIINLAQFFLYLFLAPETAGFVRSERASDGSETTKAQPTSEVRTPWWHLYFKFSRVSNDPWSQLPMEIVRPLAMAVKLPVILPTVAYSVAFAYCNVSSAFRCILMCGHLADVYGPPRQVLLTVEIPALLGRKYNLNAQQVGLQFVGAVIVSTNIVSRSCHSLPE